VAALSTERALLEGDLRAMQARVDPDLLFDTLLAVDRAYARSIRSGEEALDALIGFLRAALPAESRRNVHRGERARACARLPGGEGAALAVRTGRGDEGGGGCTGAPMPAMLMLPLVRWALDGRPAVRLQLMVRRSEGALGISVESDLAEAPPSPESDLAGVRKRLNASLP